MTDGESVAETVAAAADAGGAVALESFRKGIEEETKGGADQVVDGVDVVTQADRDAQRRVIERIRAATDEGVVVGEEEDERKQVPEEGLAWVIDPIDGTYNFVRDMVNWATCVAATRDGEPVAAATVLPAVGDRYVADGETVRFNESPVSVSERTDPATFVVTPISMPSYGDRRDYRQGIADLFEGFGDVRRIGSIGITLALIATGALDGTATAARVSPWDAVGGVHMVRLAGGTVTDAEGNRWTPGSRGLVASNGRAHEELLEVGARLGEGVEADGGT